MTPDHLWKVPGEMQAWCAVPYRLVARGNGRMGKVPVDREGRPCNHRDPRHHEAYGDVVARVAAGEADGLGVVLPEGAVMLDVDDCVLKGRVDERTEGLLESLGSYTEVSQSGKGVKTFALGQKPGARSRGNGLELYGPGQYAALTGNVYGPYTTLQAAQEAIDTIYGMIGPARPLPVVPRVTPLAPAPSDLELTLERARRAKNGSKFQRLFDEGDITGYASASDADYALLNMLRFWFGPHPDLLDELMRRSALMRPKWDRATAGETYGHRTINSVIARGGATWTRRR
ncbi:primase-polymerase (primpol)-like protein [Deinococcus sp. HSC-46F16]|uniref:phage NrS-1 polymerase family protein n=1 Tax=Deinococcus sp. HSC-46F16 TaxID=2910968 RepID=UPI0020A042C8|nr:hypothetical protein [Deinococcus sp. HSC-46F16]MCP2014802.1 primase-polymerase (primpol)-like protein [Deinococcus sp. HSC-46F16]